MTYATVRATISADKLRVSRQGSSVSHKVTPRRVMATSELRNLSEMHAMTFKQFCSKGGSVKGACKARPKTAAASANARWEKYRAAKKLAEQQTPEK